MKNINKFIHTGILAVIFPCFVSAQVPFPDLIIENVTHNNQNVNYQNSHGITSPASPAQPVLITGTSQVEYKAGTRISLLPGFKASGLTGTGRYHALIAPPDFEVAIIEPTATPGTVGKYEKFEMGLKLPVNVNQLVDDYLVNNNPAGINPYDPDEISITATFISPSGTQNRIMYGFYMKDYVRNYTNQTWDTNNATINYPWRIRFAPTELNTINNSWTCNITISSPYFVTLSVNNIKFNCVASSNKGYLQVGLHKRHLKFSGTGDPFFAIGQDIPWAEGGWRGADAPALNFSEATNLTDSWETSLANSGGNFMRMVIAPWSHEFEWEKLGDYNNRQREAWELDKVIKIAETNGIYLMLNLVMHTNFQAIANNPGGNALDAWEYNPYNSNSSHNNGTYSGVTNPHLFLTNAESRKYFQKKQSGSYTVTLIVTDPMGIKDTLSQQIYVPNCNSIIGSGPDDLKANKTSLSNKGNSDNENNLSGVSIYPNPNNGKFELQFSGISNLPVYISVYDMLGNIVLHTKLGSVNKEEIDLGAVSKGVYFVKVINGENTIIKKITVE